MCVCVSFEPLGGFWDPLQATFSSPEGSWNLWDISDLPGPLRKRKAYNVD